MAKKLTPYEWLTSDDKAAQEWRNEASMAAWNRVYDQAAKQSGNNILPLPAEPIERPPVKAPGKFFTVPATEESEEKAPVFKYTKPAAKPKPAGTVTYFQVPTDSEE